MQTSLRSLTYPCNFGPRVNASLLEMSLELSAAHLGIPLSKLAELIPMYGHSTMCPILGSGRFIVSPCTSHEGHHLVLMQEVMKLRAKRAAAAATGPAGAPTASNRTSSPPTSPVAGQAETPPRAAVPVGVDDGDVAAGSLISRRCRSMDEMLNGSFTGPHTGLGPDWPLTHIWMPHSGCMTPSLRPMHAVPLLHERGVRRCEWTMGTS